MVAVPSSCGKSSIGLRMLNCREQHCDIVFENIVWYHSENNVPHHLKILFVKGMPDFQNAENTPSLLVFDY